jgi:hypothetical protein
VYRIDVDNTNQVDTVWLDDEAQLLCHPTNCAFWDTSLNVANIGRCHISRLDVGTRGLPLPPLSLKNDVLRRSDALRSRRAPLARLEAYN